MRGSVIMTWVFLVVASLHTGLAQKTIQLGSISLQLPSKGAIGKIGEYEVAAIITRTGEVAVGVAAISPGEGKTTFVVATKQASAPYTVTTDNWQLSRWKNARWSVIGALTGSAVALRCSPYSEMAPDYVYLMAPLGVAEYTIPEAEFRYSVSPVKCSGTQLPSLPTFVREYSYDAYSLVLDARSGRAIHLSTPVSDLWECNGALEGLMSDYSDHDEDESPRNRKSGTRVTIDAATGDVRRASK
jgi:hypothetical protein